MRSDIANWSGFWDSRSERWLGDDFEPLLGYTAYVGKAIGWVTQPITDPTLCKYRQSWRFEYPDLATK